MRGARGRQQKNCMHRSVSRGSALFRKIGRRSWPIYRWVREQAFGEVLDPDKLERLGR
jgi:hypothetical protein